MSEEVQKVVLSSVVQLLRRHSSNNQLCCDNNENDLEVTELDSYGFVTYLKCTKCQQTLDTACYDAKWSYERIYDEDKLKPGDHICWHRWYAIWHHAIVTSVEPLQLIHYSNNKKVEECESMPEVCSECCIGCNRACSSNGCCSSCNALYRINYEDCYDDEYTILRAKKLKDESRYDLLEKNCEHFSCWCKTGTAKSTQVGTFWASMAKIAVTIGMRLVALILLSLLQYSYEVEEDQVKNRKQLQTQEVRLIVIYTAMITMVFMIYMLVTSCSRLAVHPERIKQQHDTENPCSCLELHGSCTQQNRCHCCCCCCCGCLQLFFRAIRRLWFCRHIKSSPYTCCRRPCNLACGLFWRIVIREMLAAGGTLGVLLSEEWITNIGHIAQMSPIERTALLMFFSMVAHILCYGTGIFVGRWFETCCDRCRPSQTEHLASGSESQRSPIFNQSFILDG